MCIFTDEVRSVAGTRILARLENGWQYLAYEMNLASSGDTAMVLPLPVAPGAAEDAASFISLEDYPEIFDHLETAFPDPFEELYGREVAEMQQLLSQRELREAVADPKTRPEDTRLHIDLTGRDPDEGMTAIPYDKGANFLRVLEKRFGRERFDAFLRRWFDSHRFHCETF